MDGYAETIISKRIEYLDGVMDDLCRINPSTDKGFIGARVYELRMLLKSIQDPQRGGADYFEDFPLEDEKAPCPSAYSDGSSPEITTTAKEGTDYHYEHSGTADSRPFVIPVAASKREDPECAALRAIVTALETMPANATRRIMLYLESRFGGEHK